MRLTNFTGVFDNNNIPNEIRLSTKNVVSKRNIYTTDDISSDGDNTSRDEANAMGRLGVSVATVRLRRLGMDARITEPGHPFDVLIYGVPDTRPLAGLEVKWIGETNKGTRIDKKAKKRKLAFAEENGVKRIYTVIVMKNGSKVGWREGIRNLPPGSFSFDLDNLVSDLRSVGA